MTVHIARAPSPVALPVALKPLARIGTLLGLAVSGLSAHAALAEVAPVAAQVDKNGDYTLYVETTCDAADKGTTKSAWVAATIPALPGTMLFRQPSGIWLVWDGKTAPAPMATTADDSFALDALGGIIPLGSVPGAQVYVACGRDWASMLAQGDYALAYTQPASPQPISQRYVSTSGNDAGPGTLDQPWRTIQHAVSLAGPGTTVYVRGGTYAERVTIDHSGSAAGGWLTLSNYPGETPVIDGSTLTAPAGSSGLITLSNPSYVQVSGFELHNYSTSSANAVPAGIYVHGAGEHIVVSNNYVHDISTKVNSAAGNAFGIAVYGDQAPAAISAISIANNEVAHLATGSSESMSLNGNVQYFSVVGNTVHDNNNIGIDIIGYEGTSPDSQYDRAREGLVASNTVYNISSYGNPAYGKDYSADGIYVDGGTRVIIERNTVHNADIGIEVASEHAGKVSDYVTVRSNLVYASNMVGLSIGGYNANVGGTSHATIVGNTFYQNDTQNCGTGEITIQYHAADNRFLNNIVYAGKQGQVLSESTSYSASPLSMNNNLYYAGGSALNWQWNGRGYASLPSFSGASGNDAASLATDPLLASPATLGFTLSRNSPAIGAGQALDELTQGALDLAGGWRTGVSPDIGAYHHFP